MCKDCGYQQNLQVRPAKSAVEKRNTTAGNERMRTQRKSLVRLASLFAVVSSLSSNIADADESGVSFWLPGQYGSFAAMPYSGSGWAFEMIYYRAKASASAGISFQRGGDLQVGVNSPSDLFMVTPTYVFETPFLGAQAAVGVSALVGRNTTSVSATLTGPGGNSISGNRSDDIVGFGDLAPTASLTWSRDVHNLMVYATANVPVGFYSIDRLAALGIGHWAIDGGAGYTYFNEQAGFEWTAVLGFTYNFINPSTRYQSGIDAHLDWAISPYVSDKMHIGAGGYFYNQLTGDSGPGALLGDFKSRVAGIGPQIGFFFPIADRQAYLNIKGYHEFEARNRPDGWSAWITLSFEPPERRAQSLTRRR